MENKEMILDELTNFEKRKPKEIPHILEEYLIRIAKTGDTMFPWIKLKPLFMCKMERVISEFNEMSPTDDLAQCPNVERFKYELMKEKLLQAIDNFCSSAPFTIQRLCELITTPRKHYKHTEKFMRGLEKNVLVVSTVEPGCSHIFACDCARKRADHQNSMMNGIIDAPNAFNGVDMYSAMYAEEEREQLLSTSDDELNSNDVGNGECPPSTSPLPNVSNDETTEEPRKTSSDENYKSKTDNYPSVDEPELETPFPSAIISTSPPPTLEASSVSFITNNKNGSVESPKLEDTADKEEEYNSDDTVSSSTQYSGESKKDAIVKITKVTTLEDKNETDTKLDSDLVTGNDSSDVIKETDAATDKTDEEIDSSSQVALRECDDEKVPDNALSNKEKVSEEKCDESVETSSIEESDEASSSQYVRSPTFGKSGDSEIPMERTLEEEQPSSSDLGTDDSSCKTITDSAVEANEETPVTTMNDANEEEAMCSNSEDMTVSSVVISEINDASPSTESQSESLLSSSSTSSSSSSSSFPSQTPPLPLSNTASLLTEQNVSSEETVLEDVTFSNINASEDAEMLPVEDMPEPMEED